MQKFSKYFIHRTGRTVTLSVMTRGPNNAMANTLNIGLRANSHGHSFLLLDNRREKGGGMEGGQAYVAVCLRIAGFSECLADK